MFVKGQEQLIGPWGAEEDSQQLLRILKAKPSLKAIHRKDGLERQANVKRLLHYDFMNIIRNTNIRSLSPKKPEKPVLTSDPSSKEVQPLTKLNEFKIKHGLPQKIQYRIMARPPAIDRPTPLNYRSLEERTPNNRNAIRIRSGSGDRLHHTHARHMHSQRQFFKNASGRIPHVVRSREHFRTIVEGDYNFIRRRSLPGQTTKKLL